MERKITNEINIHEYLKCFQQQQQQKYIFWSILHVSHSLYQYDQNRTSDTGVASAMLCEQTVTAVTANSLSRCPKVFAEVNGDKSSGLIISRLKFWRRKEFVEFPSHDAFRGGAALCRLFTRSDWEYTGRKIICSNPDKHPSVCASSSCLCISKIFLFRKTAVQLEWNY